MKNQYRSPVNVWGRILGPYLIVPNCFEEYLNGLMFQHQTFEHFL